MNARITVRQFRQQDFQRILSIETASFGGDAYDRNLFAEFYDKCGSLFLVAEDRGCVCGYAITCIRRTARNGVRSAELISIAVDPPSRGAGVASRLLEHTLRRLRRRNVDRLTLMVRLNNDPARAFYSKYGFRRVRRVHDYYHDGGDGLLMKLELKADC